MTPLDWILVILWGGVALSGFWKGAVRLVFGIGGLVVGIWLAIAVGQDLGIALAAHVAPSWIAAALGRVVPILAAVLLFGLAGWGIDRTLKALRLGWLNRLMGAGLAGVAGAILLGVLLVLSLGISPQWAELCQESLLFPYFVELSQWVFGTR